MNIVRKKLQKPATTVALLALVACGLFAACDPVPPGPVPPGTPKCGGYTPTIAGTPGNDLIRATAGRDIIHALGGDDYIEGLGGSDTICGGTGKDTIHGGTEADIIEPGEDAGNIVVGGAGAGDIISYEGFTANGTRANLTTNTDNFNNLIREVESVIGTKFNDVITGNNGNNSLIGAGGSDEIHALGGDDLLYNSGTAPLGTWFFPGAGNDHVEGTAVEADTVDYRDAVNLVSVDLVAGFARGGSGNDTLKNIDGVNGSDYGDVIIATNGKSYVDGRGGADQIHPQGGNDNVQGGEGVDHVFFTTATQGVQVDLSNLSATGQGTDVLRGIENVTGSRFDDLLIGTTESNFIDGAAGIDFCDGLGGGDYIINCP